MDHLGRKITLRKWRTEANEPRVSEAVADLSPGCGAVSFWTCQQEIAATLEEVALAVISAPNARLDPFSIVVVSEATLRAADFPITESPGDTAVVRLRQRHRDVHADESARKQILASLLMECINRPEQPPTYRFNKIVLHELLRDAVARGDVEVAHLSPKVQEAFLADD